MREIAFAFANLVVAVLLLKHVTYTESEDNCLTFIGWIERDEFPDIEKLSKLLESNVTDSKVTGALVYSDFKKSSILVRSSEKL